MILSDGRETAGRFGFKEALAHARESTAYLYAVSPRARNEDEMYDESVLKEIVETTGGRLIDVRRSADYPSILDGLDIRRQYVIGYALPAFSRTGKWRKVRVQLRNAKSLRVYWRRGYFAPESQTTK